MNRKLALLSALTLAALGSPSSAQVQQQGFGEVIGPIGRVHYDMASGEITKLVRPRQVAAHQQISSSSTRSGSQRATSQTFRNTIASGYFTSGNLGHEFVDWATKKTARPFATAITIGYATRVSSTSIGGPGASLDLNFYSGTTGFCSLGSQFASVTFAGLPGRTASLPPGFGQVYLVTAFLSPGLAVPDGALGWGYTFLDSDGAGASRTGPILTDFGTNTGWQDAFDDWAGIPASLNTCLGAFFFGGCSGPGAPPPTGTPCGSFYLGLTEYTPTVQASCTARNTTNPNDLVALTPPVIGQAFSASTVQPTAAWAITAGPLPGTPLSGLLNGDLLCNPSVLFGPVRFTTNGILAAPLPLDAGLEGIALCVQAAELIGPGRLQLTNALDCVVGG